MHRYTAQGRKVISIHTLLAESDIFCLFCFLKNSDFYPHSPCGERHLFPGHAKLTTVFLSTLSLRRATPAFVDTDAGNLKISIHTLLAESDPKVKKHGARFLKFLSTLSLRRATAQVRDSANQTADFYPHSPCGERRYPGLRSGQDIPISIHTLLAESDAGAYYNDPCKLDISIHTLLAESDRIDPDQVPG